MYLSFYGLQQEPFLLTPDPRFVHLAETHRAVLLQLLETVVHRRGFMVLTGNVGTGKTTLLHTALHLLSKQLSPQLLSSAMVVNPTCTAAELVELILQDFEVECQGTSKPARLGALQKMFMSMHRQNGRVLLIVDESHLMSPDLLEEIRLLSNFEAYDGKLVQIILSGQPELMELLDRRGMAALKQRVAAWGSLRNLTAIETRAYIAQRLHAAGLRNRTLFSGPALASIHAISEGVPRVINLICNQALTIGARNGMAQIDPDVLEQAALELRMPWKPQFKQVTVG